VFATGIFYVSLQILKMSDESEVGNEMKVIRVNVIEYIRLRVYGY
jgi:hypothetical protein